jgi:5-methylcytosine-specific restriction enzyme subunit McrC
MLSYAFRALNAGGLSNMGGEEFENLQELFAEIIIQGMRKQLKRGLPRKYSTFSEELNVLRGKININTSVRQVSIAKRRLVCEFDEFTENTPGNQLIKCAITHLLRHKELSSERKHFLKFLRSSLNGVSDVRDVVVAPQRSGGAEYIMLVNVCRFLIDGLLLNTGSGYKLREWLTDEAMSSLYERFLLEYFRKHHSYFKARPARIDWDMDNIPSYIPQMISDVYLTYGDKTMIIDAKYYSRSMVDRYGKKAYHSNNLYQMFTYVKNADKARNGNVSGMILYAKTDEDITPDDDGNNFGGNTIRVSTLDMSKDFSVVELKLESLANALMQCAICD